MRVCVCVYIYIRIFILYIAARDIRSATETGVLVTWPNIIDLPIRYTCRTLSLTKPPVCDSGEDILCVYTQKRASHNVHMYTQEMRSQHFLPFENSIPYRRAARSIVGYWTTMFREGKCLVLSLLQS